MLPVSAGAMRDQKPSHRWTYLLEALSAFAVILIYIWWLRPYFPWLWIAILALIVVSHFLHHEGPARLGFGWREFKASFPVIVPWVLGLALAVWGTGMVFHSLREATPSGLLQGLCLYLPWGVFQQYLLNGYFVNRLLGFFGNATSRAVPLAAGILFAGAHAPNWFLMIVTLCAGYVCARVFVRYRSVLSLGLAHGILGFLLFLVVPDSISAHLVVGPRYWSRP